MNKAAISCLQLLGRRAEQQDAFAYDVRERGGQQRIVIAVADGHDHNGGKAAKYAVTEAMEKIKAGPDDDLPAIFREINDEMVTSIPSAGTTLTLAISEARALTIAYVGDSEAWIAKRDGLQRLTVPHRHGQHRGETQRLDDQFGPSRTSGGAITLLSGAYLSVTHALGDREFEPYVLHVPEVRHIELCGDERFLLVGSDGFWECATKRKNWRRQLRSTLIGSSSGDEAVRMIASQIEGRVSDNCTLLLARINC